MSKEHAYEIDGNNFKGYFAQADSNKAPCVLIAHTWAGRDGFVEEKAEELAKLGYVWGRKNWNFCGREFFHDATFIR